VACVALDPTSVDPVLISAALRIGARLTGDIATGKISLAFEGLLRLTVFIFSPVFPFCAVYIRGGGESKKVHDLSCNCIR